MTVYDRFRLPCCIVSESFTIGIYLSEHNKELVNDQR